MRRIAGTVLALGLLAVAGWLLWRQDRPVNLPVSGARDAAAEVTPAVPAGRKAEPTSASKSVDGAVAPEGSAEVRAAAPAGIRERDAARARLSAAWTCLDAPDFDPGDAAEIWPATLTPEHQRQAEQDYAQVIAWAEQNCRSLPPELLDKDGRLSLPELLALAGTGPDDPRWRLAALLRERKTHDRASVDGVRAALEALLRSTLEAPTAEEMQLIGSVVSTQGPLGAFGPGSGAQADARRMVWALAACDLGDDCGPRSPVLRQLCAQSLLCGYPDLESAVLDGVWPQGMAAALQEERRRLVQRLRDGGGVGVFDPVSNPAPGGP